MLRTCFKFDRTVRSTKTLGRPVEFRLKASKTCSRRDSSSRGHVDSLVLLLFAHRGWSSMVLLMCAWQIERPHCGWKTKLDASVLRVLRDARCEISVNANYTLRGVLFSNRLSADFQVFGKPQKMVLRSSFTCVSSWKFYIPQNRYCWHLE